MKKILFILLTMFLLQGCRRVIETHTLTYCVHYPSRVDTITVKCHSFRYRTYRGSSVVSYCTNFESHVVCNAYSEHFETTAPIEIVNFK